jgi:hypothetical protein
VYSLVSAPILGFDLARLDGGAATAELLLAALTLASDDLDVLAARLPVDDLRAELWQEVDAGEMRRYPVRRLAGMDPSISLRLVERAPIGSLNALLHCLRHDVLDWTWSGPDEAAADLDGHGAAAPGSRAAAPGEMDDRGIESWPDNSAARLRRPVGRQTETAARASALLCDALVASYLREELSESTRRRLAAGWVAAARRVPARPADLGPQHRAVARTLDRIRRAAPAELARLVEVVERDRRRTDWAAAMHSASWAVYMSGRVRAAAAAQLQLVVAVHDAHVPVPDVAAGCWNALSGAVQALAVGDLLDAKAAGELLEPYLVGFGRSDGRG